MAGLVSWGAGAAEGLQEFLLQKLREAASQRQDRQLEEDIRSNLATEDYRNRQLTETSELRNTQQAGIDLARSQAQGAREAEMANKTRDDMRASLDDLLADPQTPGRVMITPETRNRAVAIGAALPDRFEEQRVPEDFVGPIQEDQPQRGDIGSFLMKVQPKGAQAIDPNLQRETVSIGGKPVDVLINPKTGEVRHMGANGAVIDPSTVSHYERPREDPQGSFSHVLIGTKQGRFNNRTGEFSTPDGQVISNPDAPETASSRTMREGSRMIRPHIPELATLAKELDRRGLFGPVMSRIRNVTERLGTAGSPEEEQANASQMASTIADDPQLNTDELVGQFSTTLGLMTSGAGRVHGGAKGGGSIQMIQYLKSLLSANGSLSMFNGRLKALDSFLKTYAEGTDGTPAAAPTDGTGGFRVLGSRPK